MLAYHFMHKMDGLQGNYSINIINLVKSSSLIKQIVKNDMHEEEV